MEPRYHNLIINCRTEEEYRQIVDTIGWFDGLKRDDIFKKSGRGEKFAVRVEIDEIVDCDFLAFYKDRQEYSSYTFKTASEVLQKRQSSQNGENMEPRFKVGDRVRITTNPDSSSYPPGFVSDMHKYKGKIVVISESWKLSTGYCYEIEGSRWDWAEHMLEPADEDKAVEEEKKRQETPKKDEVKQETELVVSKVRPYADRLMDDQEVLIALQALISKIKEESAYKRSVFFPPEKFVFPKTKLEADGLYFDCEEADIDRAESLRLLGAVIYHLMIGESELNRESYLLDGYRKPLAGSKLWPVIALLLSGSVSDPDVIARAIKASAESLNPEASKEATKENLATTAEAASEEDQPENKTLEIITRGGGNIIVNTSNKVCLRFRFRHGDRIIDPSGNHGTVMGVACGLGFFIDSDVLWYLLDKDNGRANFYSGDTNLRAKGFRLESEEANKQSDARENSGESKNDASWPMLG